MASTTKQCWGCRKEIPLDYDAYCSWECECEDDERDRRHRACCTGCCDYHDDDESQKTQDYPSDEEEEEEETAECRYCSEQFNIADMYDDRYCSRSHFVLAHLPSDFMQHSSVTTCETCKQEFDSNTSLYANFCGHECVPKEK